MGDRKYMGRQKRHEEIGKRSGDRQDMRRQEEMKEDWKYIGRQR